MGTAESSGLTGRPEGGASASALAAALLYERGAVLGAKLTAAGVDVPEGVLAIEDPVERFRALDRVRLGAGLHHLGAPWDEVLRRLGIQMGPDLARQLVRAFAALPRDLSSEMDDAGVALATRLEFLRLDRGARDAGRQFWDLVKARGRPDLLGAAARERLAVEDLDAAAEAHKHAHRARAAAARRAAEQRCAGTSSASSPDAIPPVSLVEAHLVEAALVSLKRLLATLRGGAALSPFDAGSLTLAADELLMLARPDGTAQ